MKNIVISLESAKKRRSHISTQFSTHSLSFKFFNALTPEQAIKAAKALQIDHSQNTITDRELACFMSHVMVWQKIVNEKLSHAAVFEDDIYLGKEASQFLNSSDWIKPKWQIVKLEAFSQTVHLGHPISPLLNSRSVIRPLKGRHLGAAGYILSLEAARYLIQYVTRYPVIEPLDHIIFDDCIKLDDISIFQITPALCIQSFLYDGNHTVFPSDLENERIIRRKKESVSRSVVEKLLRELKRIYTQLYKFFFNSKVPFH